MAETDNTIKTTVVLDTTQAQQQIARLGAVASDSTKSLEERTAAKNEQVKLQNQLAQQTINNLKKEKSELEKLEGTEKDILKLEAKINKEKVKATRIAANGEKQQNKMNEALKDSKDATKNLDDATGGLLGKMKAFLTNPIGIVVTAIAAAFQLLRESVSRSGEASETFSQISKKLEGVFNGLLAVLEPVVIFLGETLLKALENPKQAILDLGNTIKENLINRVKAFLVLGDAIVELFKGNFKEASKLAADGMIQFTTGVTDATDKIAVFAEEAEKNYTKAANATDKLANSEKVLAQNRIALEKQQLTSLRLAEEQRQIRDDISKTIPERIAANKELGKILDDQLQTELALAQQSLDLAKAQKTATGDTIENLEAVGDAEIKLLEIQERITGQRSEQIVNEQALIKEGADLKAKNEETDQARRDRELNAQIELDELKLEQKKSANDATLEEELNLLARRQQQELANTELLESEKNLIIARYADAATKIIETSEAAKQAAKQESAANSIAAAAEAFGIQKEVAIAEMIIAAPKAIGESYKSAATNYPFPLSIAMGSLGAIGTVAPIIKGLADIRSTRFPGKGGDSSSGGSSGSISTSSATGSVAPATQAVSDIAANNAARLGTDSNIGATAGSIAANNVLGSTSGNVVFSESSYQEFQNQVQFKEDKSSI